MSIVSLKSFFTIPATVDVAPSSSQHRADIGKQLDDYSKVQIRDCQSHHNLISISLSSKICTPVGQDSKPFKV
jgi:hypothetical protein